MLLHAAVWLIIENKNMQFYKNEHWYVKHCDNFDLMLNQWNHIDCEESVIQVVYMSTVYSICNLWKYMYNSIMKATWYTQLGSGSWDYMQLVM